MTDRADEEEQRCTCGAGHGSLEGHVSWCGWAESAARPLTDAQIKHMVDRFLQWEVPADFSPDGGVKFEPTQLHGGGFHRPVGTNLFTATQAEAMIRNMLEGMPAPTP